MASKELLKTYGFDEEVWEERTLIKVATGFPVAKYRHKLIFEANNVFLEQYYFWIYDHLIYDWGFSKQYKITDVFAASQQSSFFAVSEQRLGLQQDKASQYLKGISDMLKALFQIVREIRIIDERLDYYNDTYRRGKDAISSEISLKGIWIDQVEGGVKNAASVYGLAQTVGFSVLPDLFFRIKVSDQGMHELIDKPDFDKRMEEIPGLVDAEMKTLEFNEKVKEVLQRKLVQYYMWKGRTYKELFHRRKFTIKYLRQHYDTIKLYMGWVKPYLKNIQRLQMDQSKMDNAEMVGAFEGSIIEVEVLHTREKESNEYVPCFLTHFLFITKPTMTYTGEGYQRGPGHAGKMEMTLRGYVWTRKNIKNYLRMKEEEDLELLGNVDASIKEALTSLGDELKEYLKQGGEEFEEPETTPPEKPKFSLEPFTGIFGGFKELFGPLVNVEGLKNIRSKQKDNFALYNDQQEADSTMKRIIYQTYKNFKKGNKMISW